jgi:hypothetical protein
MILEIQKIQKQIGRIAAIGSVAFSWHCRNKSMIERNVDSLDILKVLRSGLVSHEPDPETDMKFRIVGEDVQSQELTVIIELIDEDSLAVITVW